MCVDQGPVALVQTRVALLQKRVALVGDLFSSWLHHLLHPLLTPLGNFETSLFTGPTWLGNAGCVLGLATTEAYAKNGMS